MIHMRKLIPFLIFLFPLSLAAQNYAAYVPNRTAFFKQHLSAQDYNVDAISADSALTVGNFTKYHEYRHESSVSLTFSCFYLNDTGWAGKYFLQKPNGVTCFLNRYNDSIWFFPSAAIGQDGFVFSLTNGDTIHGSVISVAQQNVFGSLDSVKTMQLQKRDASGNPLADIFNGKYLQVSKNHGCLLGYAWLDFPNDTNAFQLSGMANPPEGTQMPPADSIFNFNIGDRFDFTIANNSSAQSNPTMLYYHSRTVTAKNVSANGDTVTYTFLEDYAQKIANTILAQYTGQPVNVTYIISAEDSSEEISLLPHQYAHGPDTTNGYLDGYSFFPYNNTQYNGRIQKGFSSIGAFFYYDNNSHCFLWDGDSPDVCDGHGIIFADGIGEVYGHDGSATCFNDYNLNYFSKGNETWGTPLNWSVILGTGEIALDENMYTWPNPVNDMLTVSFRQQPVGEITYCIYNQLGEMVSNEKTIATSPSL